MAQAVKKIAILGGGLGSLSTAFALTNESNWKERYEITIYQIGWRLGGKGRERTQSGSRLSNTASRSTDFMSGWVSTTTRSP